MPLPGVVGLSVDGWDEVFVVVDTTFVEVVVIAEVVEVAVEVVIVVEVVIIVVVGAVEETVVVSVG